eukprot:14499284-Ditylum_brightwellii.AAC.1
MGTRRTSHHNGGVVIKMSDTKYNSDCMTLTYQGSCAATSRKSSHKKKSFQHLSKNARCQQLWLSKHGTDDSYTSIVQRHAKVQNYLNIALNVALCYASVYSKEESRPTDLPSGQDYSPAAAATKQPQLAVPTCVTPIPPILALQCYPSPIPPSPALQWHPSPVPPSPATQCHPCPITPSPAPQ